MVAFLPIAVLMSLLVTGTTADGYGSQTTPSSSTPASYTPTPATPPPQPTATPPAPYTPPSKPAHDYDHDKNPAHDYDHDKNLLLVVVHVEGVVLCQSCVKQGSQSLEGAAPLPKATVVVTCRDRKNRVMAYRRVVADSNGYFRAEFGVERADDFWTMEPRGACFVRLLSSPDPKCNILTNIHGGIEGAPLRDEGKHWIDVRGLKNIVHAADPLAFRPAKCEPTRHY